MAVVLEDITCRFGPRVALQGATLRVKQGELHALLGENGAGKSTLMRILAGLIRPDQGRLSILGQTVERLTPARSIALGVGMVHQHFMLVPTLTVAENVVLGQEPRRGPLGIPLVLDRRRAERDVAELGERYGLVVDPGRRVGDLGVGEAQRVEILKVLYRGARVLVLDEPTAVLLPQEVEALLSTVRALCRAGKSAILISHKLDEILSSADRITVLRRGQTVGELDPRAVTAAQVAEVMVGEKVTLPERTSGSSPGAPVRLAVEGLCAGPPAGSRRLRGLDLQVREGEIVGIAGVEGNGQTELWEALAGVIPTAGGRVLLDGRDITRTGTGERLRAGLALVPEDRHRRGLALDLPVAENLVLDRLASYATGGGWLGLARGQVEAHARELIARYDVRPTDPAALAGELSGGNQQKLVMGRALAARPAGPGARAGAATAVAPRVLLCAQPTRGVDLGAVARIHRELLEARAAGLAILLFSAELTELLALSDRIGVLRGGQLQAMLPASEADIPSLGRLMLGASA
jgi:simple sugar transport system ATP-binding protein